MYTNPVAKDENGNNDMELMVLFKPIEIAQFHNKSVLLLLSDQLF